MKYSINLNIEDKVIDYRRLSTKDFFDKDKTEIIDLPRSDNDYLTDAILENVDFTLQQPKTYIFNIATGGGKTTAIIRLIERAVNDNKTVIVASPTVSLVDKYTKLIESLNNVDPDNDIVIYNDIFNIKKGTFLDLNPQIKKVHIITINSLLGNYGEEAIKQNEDKRNYLIYLSEYLEDKNPVIIFDELHEGVQSFNPDFYLNFKHLFEKCKPFFVIASATFSESSIYASKLLVEMSDCYVKVLQSKRYYRNNRSNLTLIIYDADKPTPMVKYILKNLTTSFESNSKITIITATKSMAKTLENDCTEEKDILNSERQLVLHTADKKNEFDDSNINIGTTIKSGFDLIDENHKLIIILPFDVNLKNIFSRGAVDLHQAIGRQRNGGEIFIISPCYKINALGLKNVSKEVNKFLDKIEYRGDKKIQKLSQGLSIIKYTYEENFKDIVKYGVSSDKMNINLTTEDEYILRRGDKVLMANYSFGKHLVPYLLYAILNNQFQNAKPHRLVCYVKPGRLKEYLKLELRIKLGGKEELKSLVKEKEYGIIYQALTDVITLNNRIIKNRYEVTDTTQRKSIKKELFEEVITLPVDIELIVSSNIIEAKRSPDKLMAKEYLKLEPFQIKYREWVKNDEDRVYKSLPSGLFTKQEQEQLFKVYSTIVESKDWLFKDYANNVENINDHSIAKLCENLFIAELDDNGDRKNNKRYSKAKTITSCNSEDVKNKFLLPQKKLHILAQVDG